MRFILFEFKEGLLILGAPGAGKTTLLLELTRHLLDRAERYEPNPPPIKQRSETRKAALQTQLQRLEKRIDAMERERILETRSDDRLRLAHKIEDARQESECIRQELAEAEAAVSADDQLAHSNAQTDSLSALIPVVFHLASWAQEQAPLHDWLIEELVQRYDVPRNLSRSWVANNQILPLLDGLDEVALAQRSACVDAINDFRRARAFLPVVVCSRIGDYNNLATRLRLPGAVFVQPLTRSQVDACLQQAGQPLAAVRAALQDDEIMWELLETPLMLNIVSLAYQGRSVQVARAEGDIDARRTQIFQAYVDAMFARRGKPTRYTKAQTLRWLTWLADTMKQHDISLFYLERMQPTWLTSRTQQEMYSVVTVMIIGLLFGLLMGLVGTLFEGLTFGLLFGLGIGLLCGPLLGLRDELNNKNQHVSLLRFFRGSFSKYVKELSEYLLKVKQTLIHRLIYGLLLGLACELIYGVSFGVSFVGFVGLLFGLLFGLGINLSFKNQQIRPVEVLRWSFSRYVQETKKGLIRNLRKELSDWSLLGLAVGLLVGLSGLLPFGLVGGVLIGLGGGLFVGLLIGLLLGLLGGLAGVVGMVSEGLIADEIKLRQVPNEGIKKSIWNALFVGMPIGLFVGLWGGVLFGLFYGFLYKGGDGLPVGLICGFGLLVALASGLNKGGGLAVIRHFALRAILGFKGLVPWQYVRFLDFSVERIFLQRVGGGYAFVHRLLLDYFASLKTSTQTKAVNDEIT